MIGKIRGKSSKEYNWEKVDLGKGVYNHKTKTATTWSRSRLDGETENKSIGNNEIDTEMTDQAHSLKRDRKKTEILAEAYEEFVCKVSKKKVKKVEKTQGIREKGKEKDKEAKGIEQNRLETLTEINLDDCGMNEEDNEVIEEKEMGMEMEEDEEQETGNAYEKEKDESEKVVRFKGKLVPIINLNEKEKESLKVRCNKYASQHKGEYKVMARLDKTKTVLKKERNLVKILIELRKENFRPKKIRDIG